MVEKLVGQSFVPVRGLREIKKDDVFRTTDAGCQGPILLALSDAKQVPHPTGNGGLVWNVQTAV